MLKTLYVLAGLLLVGAYAYAGFRGLELTRTEKLRMASQSMRGAHGGSRSFWYGGYRGGK
jgi:hypothetical protein